MRIGYNTNGFAHHRLEDAIAILGELGYRSVALTLDYHALNPFDPSHQQQAREARRILDRYDMRCVIETGARYLLDPWKKHQPTLLSKNPGLRLDFLKRSIDLAQQLQADAVSLWSGTAGDPESEQILWDRLVDGCQQLCEHAERRQVRIAFEPEPGMLIDTMDRFARLYEAVSHSLFGLTLDLGHLQCQGELPMAPHIHHWKHVLWNIHIEDMNQGIHDHLMFGEGEMDFPPIFQALREIDYQHGIHVELSRHSHQAVETAKKAMSFLQKWLQK